MFKNLWITIPASLLCVLAQANTVTVASSTPANTLAAPAAATSTTEAKKEEAPAFKFSMGLGASYTMQAKEQTDGNRSESMSYTFSPSMGYGNYTLSAFTLYSQDLKKTGETGAFIDPQFTLSRKSMALNDYFKLGPSMTLILPMTDGSKNNVGLLYSISGTLSLSLQTKALGLDSWFTSYSINYNRNFTNYSTTSAGDPVVASRIRQRINLGYNFTDSLSLSTRLQVDSKYSTEGVVKNDFLHYQTLSYKVNDTISVSMGHTNSNALLNGTTYENNFKFFDDAKSEYSVGLDVSL